MKRFLVSLFAALVVAANASTAETPPNVVAIFADDLGYGDLSCYGATKLKTPNIDKLASEGRRFADAHSASAVCTPSRYALITGRYPFRKGLSKPVFLYLATTNIHHPFTPAKRFQGTSECGLYGDFVHELDWIVGEVMTTLEKNGLADDTLVIFTSDNGGMINVTGQRAIRQGHNLNGEMLGFKFDAWEGGHRAPFIARWPGKIEAGSESKQLICNVDLLATMAVLTGQELEATEGPDSFNVLPALTGDSQEPIRDHLVLGASKASHLAFRDGDWVLIGGKGGGGFGSPKVGSHAFGGPAALNFAGQTNSDVVDGKLKKDAPAAQLYDLSADPSQSTNVIQRYPDRAESMRARLEEIKASQGSRPRFTKKQGQVGVPTVLNDEPGFEAAGDFEAKSVMPDLAGAMTPDQVAGIVAYLRSVK